MRKVCEKFLGLWESAFVCVGNVFSRIPLNVCVWGIVLVVRIPLNTYVWGIVLGAANGYVKFDLSNKKVRDKSPLLIKKELKNYFNNLAYLRKKSKRCPLSRLL